MKNLRQSAKSADQKPPNEARAIQKLQLQKQVCEHQKAINGLRAKLKDIRMWEIDRQLSNAQMRRLTVVK